MEKEENGKEGGRQKKLKSINTQAWLVRYGTIPFL